MLTGRRNLTPPTRTGILASSLIRSQLLAALLAVAASIVPAAALAHEAVTTHGGAAVEVDAIVTGYANGADGGAVGTMTASGTSTHWGTVAADWRLFPIGTRLLIEGFEDVTFTVEDTGSGVRGLIFDIWFDDLAAAQAFGTQHRKVTILP